MIRFPISLRWALVGSYVLVSFLFLFSCKKDSPEDASPSAPTTFQFSENEVYESTALLDSAILMFDDLAITNTGVYYQDAAASLSALSQWLNTREDVSSTNIIDSTYLTINFASGIEHTIWLNYTDMDGTSLYRGSKSENDRFQIIASSDGPCQHVMQNKKVLHWWAATDIAFEGAIDVANALDDHPIEFEIDYLSGEECDLASFRTFNQYGMVFIETHGFPEGTLLGTTYNVEVETFNSPIDLFVNSMIDQLGLATYQELRNGGVSLAYPLNIRNVPNWYELDFANNQLDIQTRTYSTTVKSNFIAQSPPLTNTIVLNNSCNSGWQTVTEEVSTPIATSYLSLNPLAYFGYRKADGTSQPIVDSLGLSVTRDIAIRMSEEDSTGQWKIRPDGTLYVNPLIINYFDPPAYLDLFESPSHCYEDPCGPFIDERDGNEYNTACLGDYVWLSSNLNWQGAGMCFEDNPVNCPELGRLYSIEELTNAEEGGTGSFVQGLCPNGWHVPTSAEWSSSFADIYELSENPDFYQGVAELLCDDDYGVWDNGNNATNSLGMNIAPTGWGILNVETNEQQWIDSFSETAWGKEGLFWTCTLVNDPLLDSDYNFKLIRFSQDDLGNLDISFGASAGGVNGEERVQAACRCVKDY